MIKDQRDFAAGLLFMAFGAFFCFYSIAKYPLGTASRMGPGYFPMLLGGMLLFLGFLIALKALIFRSESDDGKVGAFDWRTVIIILGSVTIFALLLRPAGLIPATFIMILVSGLADRGFKFLPILLLSLFLSFLVWVIFVWGLTLTVPIWPSFM